MTDASPMWNRHLKVYADPNLEKSAFIIFVEFCSDTVIDAGEVGKLIRQRWSLRQSIFHLSGEVGAEFAASMGINSSDWERARGADFLSGRPAKRVLVGDLRYCRRCIMVGNHSALFQLPQVVQCPVHGELLMTGCHHCGKPISTNAFALARNHLYCGACNRNLATERRRSGVGGEIAHPPADAFATLRRALADPPSSGESRSTLQWGKSPEEIAASRTLARVHHAHSVWGDPTLGRGFLKIRTETLRIEAEERPVSRPEFYGLVRAASISAFEDLATRLGWRAKLSEVPLGIAFAVRSAARVDVQASTVAAAYWRCAATFEVVPFVLGEMPPPSASAQPFSAWLPDHTGAMQHVVRRVVEALFVRTLLGMRGLRYGVQVAWSDVPDPALFLVPWRLRRLEGSNQLELEIRTRVDGSTVERLGERYRRQWLLKAPEDVSLLGLVSGAASEVATGPIPKR